MFGIFQYYATKKSEEAAFLLMTLTSSVQNKLELKISKSV